MCNVMACTYDDESYTTVYLKRFIGFLFSLSLPLIFMSEPLLLTPNYNNYNISAF